VILCAQHWHTPTSWRCSVIQSQFGWQVEYLVRFFAVYFDVFVPSLAMQALSLDSVRDGVAGIVDFSQRGSGMAFLPPCLRFRFPFENRVNPRCPDKPKNKPNKPDPAKKFNCAKPSTAPSTSRKNSPSILW
jgi:hypothetical protein